MSKFGMVSQNVAKFHEEFNAIVVDLQKKIQQQRDPNTQVMSDVPNLLCKWSFECEFKKCMIFVVLEIWPHLVVALYYLSGTG